MRMVLTRTRAVARRLSDDLGAGITGGIVWKSMDGGAEALVSREQMWAVAHRSRLAELLRVRIGEFHVTKFEDLVSKLERLPWSAYLRRSPAVPPSVSAVAHKSKLIHTGSYLIVRSLWLGRALAEHTRLWSRIACGLTHARTKTGTDTGLHKHAGAIQQRVLASLYNRGLISTPPPSKSESSPHPRMRQPLPSPNRAPAFEERQEQQAMPQARGSSADTPRIFVRVHHDICTVSVDASGPALHKRG